MTTAQIISCLTTAIARRPFTDWLGIFGERELRDLIRCELGHEGILDDFQPHGTHFARAFGPREILHVVSGNTPHAGMQSLLRGLLLPATHNLLKLPTGGLPEIAAFRAALPADLAARVELSETLPEEWLARAEAVVVFGSDETIAEFRRRTRPDQKFIAHGHRVSFGIVCDDPELVSVPGAARDASRFDGRGCLSPHLFYVRGDAPAVRAYAAALAREMDLFNRAQPRATLSAGEATRIHALREDWRFRAANDPARVALWTPPDSTAWTIIFDAADSAFTASTADRVVFIKPLPPLETLPIALGPARRHLGAIGLWPATLENARAIAALGLPAARLCSIGKMQDPPLTWHQDGAPSLGGLVRWVDFEPSSIEESARSRLAKERASRHPAR